MILIFSGRNADLNLSSKQRIGSASALSRVSVILPVLHNNGHALEAIESWASKQTYPRELIELIVVSDGLEPELDNKIRGILGQDDSLIIENTKTYFRQLNVGARKASGDILFFTESHAAGLPNCIEELVRFMNETNCAGASGDMVGGTDVFFETILDELFLIDDRKYLVESKKWRKIALRAFSLRYDIYRKYGPFDEEFNLFTERAFPIALFKEGVVLEHAPNVVVKHYNAQNLKVLQYMVESFVDGECRYRSQFSASHCEEYLEFSSFWSSRTEYRREIAGARLRALQCHLKSCSSLPADWPNLIRRLPDLIENLLLHKLGIDWLLLKTRLSMFALELRIRFHLLWKSKGCRDLICKYWFDLLTHYAWLRAFKKYPETLDLQLPGQCADMEISLRDDATLSGFFAPERCKGRGFRWSMPESAVRVAISRGHYSVELQLVAGIVDPAKLNISACFDGNQLVPQVVHGSLLRFQLNEVDFADDSQHIFSLACRPTVFPGDDRSLGLPIYSIRFDSVLQATSVAKCQDIVGLKS